MRGGARLSSSLVRFQKKVKKNTFWRSVDAHRRFRSVSWLPLSSSFSQIPVTCPSPDVLFAFHEASPFTALPPPAAVTKPEQHTKTTPRLQWYAPLFGCFSRLSTKGGREETRARVEFKKARRKIDYVSFCANRSHWVTTTASKERGAAPDRGCEATARGNAKERALEVTELEKRA